jgi:hypothetical protein
MGYALLGYTYLILMDEDDEDETRYIYPDCYLTSWDGDTILTHKFTTSFLLVHDCASQSSISLMTIACDCRMQGILT